MVSFTTSMKRTFLLFYILLTALLVPAVFALGTSNGPLIEQCTITLPDNVDAAATERLCDDNVMTRVRFKVSQKLLIEVPASAKGLYIVWYESPKIATVRQLNEDGSLLSETPAGGGVLNEFLPLSVGIRTVEISAATAYILSDVAIYASATPPKHLPLSDALPQKVDLMLIAAHTGDEQSALGGVLPIYAGTRGMTCAVAFLSHKNRLSQQDAITALRFCGVDTAPIFGGFPYRIYTESNAIDDELRGIWDAGEVETALVRYLRQYRPEVLVTHNSNGEEGEGLCKLTSRLVQKAVDSAASSSFDLASEQQYGVWQVKKVYCHESSADAVHLDTDVALAPLGSTTAAEIANQAYNAYTFTGIYHRTIVPEAVYTLTASTVGRDVACDDLFEHVDTAVLTTDGVTPPPSDAPTPSPDPNAWPTAIPARPTPTPNQYFRTAGEPEETVVFDAAAGHYAYRSDNLSVIIDRHLTDEPMAYYIAHIRMQNTDAFRPAFGHNREGGMTKQSADGMARRYKAVLLITGDNLTHMEVDEKGILLRNGRYYSGNQAESTLALYPDQSMKLYFPWDTNWRTLLDDGVENTYSFGPALVVDGQVYPYAYKHRNRKRNPRIGVGMVEPGHFVAIAVDGRITTYSVGMEIMDFAKLFVTEGCTVAYNLDGGASEAMLFMGEYVNLRASAHVRTLPDGLMWGYSELVPDVDDPLHFDGIYENQHLRNDP
ncbi:MAG: phosphodiester glycosidase family protein [Clostridia bacterium]